LVSRRTFSREFKLSVCRDWRAVPQAPESRVRELEAALGRTHLEIELLKDALAKKALDAQDRCEVIRHRRPEFLSLSVERCCRLLTVSRSEFYSSAREALSLPRQSSMIQAMRRKRK